MAFRLLYMHKWILSIIVLQFPVFLSAQSFTVIGDTITICGAGVGAVGIMVKGATEPLEYTWSVGQTEPIITPYVANSSNFQVTVKDATGQMVVAVARINVNPVPSAIFLQPAPVWCPGQFTQLRIRIEGAFPLSFDYSINGILQPPVSGITSNLFVFPINKPGLYQIIGVRDGNGCRGISTASMYVTASELEANGAVRDIKCDIPSGGAISVNVTGGAPPYTYAWVGPQNIGDIPNPVGIVPGDYYLTVTDAKGCQVVKQHNVDQALPLLASLDGIQSVTCTTGGSINLSVGGGRPPYSYLWSNSLTIQDPQNIAAGTYTVTVIDRSGCQVTASAEIGTDLQKPLASAFVTDILTCENKAIVIDGSKSDAGPGFIYRWEAEPGFIISGITSLHPTVNQPGTYKLIVIDQKNGCSSSITVKVSAEKNYPVSNPGKRQTVTCVILNATLFADGSSVGTDYSYFWTAPGTGVVLGGVTTLTPIVRGVGDYTLIVTNNTNGCSSTATVAVAGDLKLPVANVDAPGYLSCTITNTSLNGLNSLPKDSLTFYWTTSNGTFLSTPIGPKASVGNAGDYTLVVTDIRNGCSATQAISVQRISDNLSVYVRSSGQLNCKNSTVTLDGSKSIIAPGTKYKWETDYGNFVSGQNTLFPIVNAPGRYTLIVTNVANNCTVSSSVAVIRDIAVPVVKAGSPSNLNCVRGEILLGDPLEPLNTRCQYSWTTSVGGNILGSKNTPVSIVNEPGSYTLTVMDTVNYCSAAANVIVGRDTTAPVAAIATPGSLSCAKSSVLIDGSGSSIGALYRYQWSSTAPKGMISGSQSLFLLAGATGGYTLMITNTSNGCTSTASAVIMGQNNDTEIEVSNSGIITCSQPIIKLSAISLTGVKLNYQWYTIDGNLVTGNVSQEAEINLAGTYFVQATNPLNGCSTTRSIAVFADRIAPRVIAGYDRTIDCKLAPISLDGSASNSGANFAYQWSVSDSGNILSDKNMPVVQVNAPGNYQLVVTNAQNGCTATDNVLILSDLQTPFADIDTPQTINCIQNEVMIDALRSSKGTDFYYQWSGPGIVSGDGTLAIKVNKPGFYTLSVRNTNGCTATATVEVKRNVVRPTPQVGGADIVLNCRFPQRPLEPVVVTSYSYLWDGPGIASDPQSANPVVNLIGNYYVTVVNTLNGCKTIDTVKVTADFNYPTADAGNTFQLTCFQNSYTIPASGTTGLDFSYNWSTVGGHILSPSNLLQPIVDGAGRYFLTVTNNKNGCIAVSSVQIYQSASVPIASSGDPVTITCKNPTPMLDATGSSVGPGIIYLWQANPGGNIVSGANTTRPMVDKPGLYVLAVTDTFNQCSSNSSITVGVDKFKPMIDAVDSMTLSCRQDVLSLNALNNSNGTYNYQWNTPNGNVISGASTLMPKVGVPGIYFLQATNPQNGCITTDSVVVLGDYSKPNPKIKLDNALNCRNTSTVIRSEMPSSAASTVYFSWFTPNGQIISTSNTASVTVNQPGRYFFSVINKDNGCADTSNMMVPIDTLHPIVDAGSEKKITCATATIPLEGSVSIPNNNYFYQWLTFNGEVILGTNSLTPIVNSGGTYTLLVQNINNGCIGSDKVTVVADLKTPKVVITPPLSIDCRNNQVLVDGSNSTHDAAISFKWATAGGYFSGNTDSSRVYVKAPGTYILTSYNHTNGCTNSDTVLVSTNLILPIVEAGIPFALTCTTLREHLQAYASNGPTYTFNWSTVSGNIVSGNNSMAPFVDKPGTYFLRVINTSTGCERVDSVTIAEETERPDSIGVLLDSITCKIEKGAITFLTVKGGVGPFLYSIDGGIGFSTKIHFPDLFEGRYTLTVQDVNGCEYDQTFEIPGAFKPEINLSEEKLTARVRDSIRIQAVIPPDYPLSRIDTVIWTPKADVFFTGTNINSLLNPVLVPQRSTTFAVKIISSDGCTASDYVTVQVDNTLYIYVANAFSPTAAQGNNRRVMVSTEDDRVVGINDFQIFDRWGSLVFEAHDFQPNDPDNGWDGTVGGKLLDPGVYTWYLAAELSNGETQIFQGNTALIR